MISKALRDWIRSRDQHCRFPGCHRRAEATDIDHTLGRANGGATEERNLALLCRNHHRLKDTAGWHLRQEANGRLIWTSPAGRVYISDPDTDSVLNSGARLWQHDYLADTTQDDKAPDDTAATGRIDDPIPIDPNPPPDDYRPEPDMPGPEDFRLTA